MRNLIACTFWLAFVLALHRSKELSQNSGDFKKELDLKGENINFKGCQVPKEILEDGKNII